MAQGALTLMHAVVPHVGDFGQAEDISLLQRKTEPEHQRPRSLSDVRHGFSVAHVRHLIASQSKAKRTNIMNHLDSAIFRQMKSGEQSTRHEASHHLLSCQVLDVDNWLEGEKTDRTRTTNSTATSPPSPPTVHTNHPRQNQTHQGFEYNTGTCLWTTKKNVAKAERRAQTIS